MARRACPRPLTVLLSFVAVATGTAGRADGAAYTFRSVADTGGPYRNFEVGSIWGMPSLNNAGEVAFGAVLAPGVSGVFRAGPSGPHQTLADTSGPFIRLGFPRINETGRVVFGAEYDTGRPEMARLYTSDGAVLTEIARWGPGLSDFSDFGPYAMNAAGTVAFVANRLHQVYTGNGDAPLLRVNGGPSGTTYSSVAINDSGAVVAPGLSLVNRSSHLILAEGGTTRTLYDGPTAGFTSFSSPAINNAGMVAFQARRAVEGGEAVDGIYVGDGGEARLVADVSGPFAQVFSPGINDGGQVVFVARLDADTNTLAHGIYTGPDPVADKVIRVGDELFGGTVARIGFLQGLNDHGQIVFAYELAGGVEGVALASPVPEPAAAAACGLAAAALMIRPRVVRLTKRESETLTR